MTTYDQHHDRVEGATKRHDAAVIARFVIIAALVVGLVLLALDNRDDVRVGYLFGDADAPIWIVLVAAAIAGMIIGWLLRHRSRRD